ncbi:hypothetical protein EON73_00175 [bacterium]|nr:MAG: hypothetical protein EON73_00175 [bacterium]
MDQLTKPASASFLSKVLQAIQSLQSFACKNSVFASTSFVRRYPKTKFIQNRSLSKTEGFGRKEAQALFFDTITRLLLALYELCTTSFRHSSAVVYLINSNLSFDITGQKWKKLLFHV